MSTRCGRCGEPMACGAGQDAPCWCNAFPPVLPPDPTLTCLCPTCLAKTLRVRIRDHFARLDRAECLALAAPYRDQKPLIEHLDYTVENGYWVFTEWFHWKRGHCCGNGCRHCPFEHEAVPVAGRSESG